jgi:hypothetical protein
MISTVVSTPTFSTSGVDDVSVIRTILPNIRRSIGPDSLSVSQLQQQVIIIQSPNAALQMNALGLLGGSHKESLVARFGN